MGGVGWGGGGEGVPCHMSIFKYANVACLYCLFLSHVACQLKGKTISHVTIIFCHTNVACHY